MLIAVALACSDPADPDPDPIEGPFLCGPRIGQLHSGSAGTATWTRASSPHILDGVVTGNVTVEAGALICGRPGSRLALGQLIAIGTAEAPIVFAPSDSTGSWSGIDVSLAGGAELAHVQVRRTTGPGVLLWSGSIRNSVVESACLSAALGCSAITTIQTAIGIGNVTVESTTVRTSGRMGIIATGNSILRLRGGSIEGSVDIGLVAVPEVGRGLPVVIVENPVRISGGASYPANVHVSAAAAMTRDSAAVVGLTGNARDTLIVHARFTSSAPAPAQGATIRKELPWTVVNGCERIEIGKVELAPGASLTLAVAGLCPYLFGQIQSAATPANPATVLAHGNQLIMSGTAGDTVRMRNVRFQNVAIRIDGSAAVFENVDLTMSSVQLLGTGSRFMNSTVDGPGPTGTLVPAEGLTLGAGARLERSRVQHARGHGVIVAGAGVSLTQCTISANTGNGIQVATGGATVTGCNLENNGGVGIANQSAETVIATDNWWGDPAGPLAPQGDGVSGAVQYQPFRTSRATTAAVHQQRPPN